MYRARPALRWAHCAYVAQACVPCQMATLWPVTRALTAMGVSEVAVVGAPDPEWGEVVVAFVVAQPGAALTANALDEHCLERMARFKRPKRYVFVPELPKNHYGKVLKTALRAQLAQQAA